MCGWGGWLCEWVYFLLKKKLNYSLLNYSHVSWELYFGKVFRISSISLLINMNIENFNPANIHTVSKHVTMTIKSFDKKNVKEKSPLLGF